MPRVSLHPFCFETHDPHAQLHARHFSSPFSGTVEDPVTGTASGVLGAFLLRYLHPAEPALRITVEQGQELGRDGRVAVEVQRREDHIDVWIEGTAVEVGERDIDIP
jgi:PhzF family phenazine biosynthesis protein